MALRMLMFSLLILMLACKAPHLHHEPLIIGHAGSGLNNAYYPPNTVRSVLHSLQFDGADGVELDVQLSGDGELFLFHDGTLESSTACSGCISERNSGYIAGCHYLAREGAEKNNIPTLNYTIKRIKEESFLPYLFLDIKSSRCKSDTMYRIAVAEAIHEQLVYDPGRVVIIGSLPELRALKRVATDFTLALSADDAASGLLQAKEEGFQAVVFLNGELSEEEALLFEDEGLKVILYEARTTFSIKEAASKHPFAILADDVLKTRNVLRMGEK